MSQGWEGILFPGEKVLWQGQPDARPDWSAMRLKDTAVGVVFAAFALFWIALALSAVDGSLLSLIFPLLGLPFLVVGLNKAGGSVIRNAMRRRNTWYTLTTQRAFIATDVMGRRSLDAYPIEPRTALTHEAGRHIWFATDFVKTRAGNRRQRIGFTHLADSERVFDLMRQVQREAT